MPYRVHGYEVDEDFGPYTKGQLLRPNEIHPVMRETHRDKLVPLIRDDRRRLDEFFDGPDRRKHLQDHIAREMVTILDDFGYKSSDSFDDKLAVMANAILAARDTGMRRLFEDARVTGERPVSSPAAQGKSSA